MALYELGLGEHAMMLARVVVEGMVSAYWMSLDPVPRADQFERFAKLELLTLTKLMLRLDWIPLEDVPAAIRDPDAVLP
jgi:hypothetical protein